MKGTGAMSVGRQLLQPLLAWLERRAGLGPLKGRVDALKGGGR